MVNHKSCLTFGVLIPQEISTWWDINPFTMTYGWKFESEVDASAFLENLEYMF